MQAANPFLEKAYWQEWNEGSDSSHVEERVVSKDCTISLAGQRYQIRRQDVQAGRNEATKVESRVEAGQPFESPLRRPAHRYLMRRRGSGRAGAVRPTGARGSERGRQEPVDGWILGAPGAGVVGAIGDANATSCERASHTVRGTGVNYEEWSGMCGWAEKAGSAKRAGKVVL
jgi:hypothetical protein